MFASNLRRWDGTNVDPTDILLKHQLCGIQIGTNNDGETSRASVQYDSSFVDSRALA